MGLLLALVHCCSSVSGRGGRKTKPFASWQRRQNDNGKSGVKSAGVSNQYRHRYTPGNTILWNQTLLFCSAFHFCRNIWELDLWNEISFPKTKVTFLGVLALIQQQTILNTRGLVTAWIHSWAQVYQNVSGHLCEKAEGSYCAVTS